jgi:tetratricopeptide (TPR) repeat protein
MLERLSVFPAGADVDGARAVEGGESPQTALDSLVAKSLLVRGSGERYGFLETVRAFALLKLESSGAADEARRALVVWALDVVDRAPVSTGGAARAAGLAQLEIEHDNLAEAMTAALASQSEDALRLACALGEFWEVRGHWREGRAAIEAALQLETEETQLRSKALGAGGQLAFLQADYDAARALHGEALRFRSATGDRAATAASLASLGMVAEARGDFESARELYGQSLASSRELGDDKGVATQLANLGNVAEYLGDYETAQTLHEQSLAQQRAFGDEQGVATSMLNLGYVMNYRGDARGRDMLEQALTRFRDVGDRYGASRALNLLAIRSWFEGDGAAARSQGEEAMRLRQEIGDKLGVAVSLESLGGLAAFQGHGIYAGRLFGAAERLREAIGSPVTPSDQVLMDWARSDARKAVGDDAFAAAVEAGKQLPLEDAIGLALTQPAS